MDTLTPKKLTNKKREDKSSKQIPLVDLKAQYRSIRDEIDEAVRNVIETSSFTLGKEVEAFERDFATFCGVKYGVGVSSGTDALHLALRGLGIGHGDEVITAPNTFIATAEAISMCGSKPVFVDIDEKTYNIDVSKIEEKINPRTRAIIPVHLYGHPAKMDAIMEIATKHRLKVIEDACQAHGARFKGKPVGSFGEAGCFSFYPGKNLGAFGDGGMVVTNDAQLAEKISLLRSHGEKEKNHHLIRGFCNRLHSLQAAVLKVKLKHLSLWNARRRENATIFNQIFEGSQVLTPITDGEVEHVYHLYVIRVKNRDLIQEKLASIGIGTGVHYPIPIHLQPAYSHLNYGPGDFPVAEKVTGEILSLPVFPELDTESVKEIAHEIQRNI